MDYVSVTVTSASGRRLLASSVVVKVPIPAGVSAADATAIDTYIKNNVSALLRVAFPCCVD